MSSPRCVTAREDLLLTTKNKLYIIAIRPVPSLLMTLELIGADEAKRQINITLCSSRRFEAGGR